ncbi:hypothetical protein [uncultured Aquimarina sp.]|uniref:hypothetical protein n=1 Tax=uncultured Aquimarina sp. TaxID=575652 RepID=UPI0026104602|nr:hypothetical protein [uncultured Aquimarina sp.]
MLKSILKINGVQELDKSEQKSLHGGAFYGSCSMKPSGICCMNGACYPGYCRRNGCFWW